MVDYTSLHEICLESLEFLGIFSQDSLLQKEELFLPQTWVTGPQYFRQHFLNIIVLQNVKLRTHHETVE